MGDVHKLLGVFLEEIIPIYPNHLDKRSRLPSALSLILKGFEFDELLFEILFPDKALWPGLHFLI